MAQEQVGVQVRILTDGKCSIGKVKVACSDVGGRLREMKVALDADIHLIGSRDTKYAEMTVTFDSLQRAGYRLKVGTTGS